MRRLMVSALIAICVVTLSLMSVARPVNAAAPCKVTEGAVCNFNYSPSCYIAFDPSATRFGIKVNQIVGRVGLTIEPGDCNPYNDFVVSEVGETKDEICDPSVTIIRMHTTYDDRRNLITEQTCYEGL